MSYLIYILCYCIICWLLGLLLERPIIAAVKLVGPGATLKNSTIRLKEATKCAIWVEGSSCSVINTQIMFGKLKEGETK